MRLDITEPKTMTTSSRQEVPAEGLAQHILDAWVFSPGAELQEYAELSKIPIEQLNREVLFLNLFIVDWLVQGPAGYTRMEQEVLLRSIYKGFCQRYGGVEAKTLAEATSRLDKYGAATRDSANTEQHVKNAAAVFAELCGRAEQFTGAFYPLVHFSTAITHWTKALRGYMPR